MTTLLAVPDLAPPTEVPYLLEDLGDPIHQFAVYGVPAPQGSKNARAIYKGRGAERVFTGKVAMQESSKKVKPWRAAVASVAHRHRAGEPLLCAIVADMVFTMPRPQRFPVGDLRRIHGRPTTTPDLSKLCRSTEDALTGVLWRDDAQAVAYRRLEKVYVGSEDPDALLSPGAIIRLWRAPGGLLG